MYVAVSAHSRSSVSEVDAGLGRRRTGDEASETSSVSKQLLHSLLLAEQVSSQHNIEPYCTCEIK